MLVKKVLISLIAFGLLGGFGFVQGGVEPRGPIFIGPVFPQLQGAAATSAAAEQDSIEPSVEDVAPEPIPTPAPPVIIQ